LSSNIDLSNNCLDVKILPNPFKNNATVEITSSCHDAVLTLYDSYGRELGHELSINKGKSESHLLSGKNMLPGIYIVKVTDGANVVRKKMIKVE
jgi:hypothetical protein